MGTKIVVTLPQDATAWDLIAETIKAAHYASQGSYAAFHAASLGLEDNFTEAKRLGESMGFAYRIGRRRSSY